MGTEQAGMWWAWINQIRRQWGGGGQRHEPPQMWASTEGPRSLGSPKVRKILNSRRASVSWARSAAAPFSRLDSWNLPDCARVTADCLWSRTVWVVAVYRAARTEKPTPQRNACFTPFQGCSCKTPSYANLRGEERRKSLQCKGRKRRRAQARPEQRSAGTV